MAATASHSTPRTAVAMTYHMMPSPSAAKIRTRPPTAAMAAGSPAASTDVCASRRSAGASAWYVALIDVRLVPSVSAISDTWALHTSTKNAVVADPATAPVTTLAVATTTTATGLAASPRRTPNRRSRRPAKSTTKAMLTVFMSAPKPPRKAARWAASGYLTAAWSHTMKYSNWVAAAEATE